MMNISSFRFFIHYSSVIFLKNIGNQDIALKFAISWFTWENSQSVLNAHKNFLAFVMNILRSKCSNMHHRKTLYVHT